MAGGNGVVPGRFTAKMDEPFVVFLIGMWLPLHKDSAAVDRRVTGQGPPGLLYAPLPSDPIRRLF
jgi:hypothetical protein